ncbi:MAG TPA: transposase [Chloroflexota bacterium]|nr:transposase [Chloroflexota bacterium]
MKLVANLKLTPTHEQAARLRATVERANAACNWLSAEAWTTRTFGQYALHRLAYQAVRARFGLTAQMAVRCIAKVADAYKADRERQRTFRPLGSIAYDDRILRFKRGDQVSLWTLDGRQVVAFVCGERQRALLAHRQGEVDLCYVRGHWYLNVVCDVPDPVPFLPADVLGVDLGIVNLAVDSDGTTYSGERIEHHRRVYQHRRRNLQRKGTRAAKRKLRALSGRQARYQAHTNHSISKAIVATAQRTGRAIALEDLGGIRNRVTARRRQRARLANWAFYQLGSFIQYKARQAGVPLVRVDPRNTSRTCPRCGVIDKANRPTQALFLCTSCRFSAPADVVAAGVIATRARAACKSADVRGSYTGSC